MSLRPPLILGTVFRLGKWDVSHRFYANGLATDTQDFELSTQEHEEAERAQIGSLSVWDPTKTTAQQANAFRPPGFHTVLELDVQRIMEWPLQVFRESEMRRLAGVRGHCVVAKEWGDQNLRKTIEWYLDW